MKNKIKSILLLFFFIIIIPGIVIITDGLIDDTNSKSKVAVIFGSKVNTDGSLSKRLKSRLDRGLQLYTDSLVNEIYVSGGLGKEGYYEGTRMAAYLISEGVPKNFIKVDNDGVNTRSTAVNFVKDYPSEASVVIVTQYFHVTRCKLAFRQIGIEHVKGVHAKHFELRDLYATIREVVGYYKYLIFY